MSILELGIDSRPAITGQKQFSSAFSRIRNDVNQTDRGFAQLQKTTMSFSSILKVAGGAFVALGLAKIAKDIIDVGKSFEQTMTIVAGVGRIDKTSAAFKALSDAARLAGETTEWSATQAAEALQYLSLAGFSAEASLASLNGTLDLATAGQLDLGAATDIATDTLSAFGLAVGDSATISKNLARVNDVLVGTSTRANTTIEQMAYGLKQSASIANTAGFEIEDLSASFGILANNMVKGEQAGTGMRSIIAKTGEAAGKLGITFESGVTGAEKLTKVLETMKQRNIDVEGAIKLFGLEAANQALILAKNVDQYKDLAKTLRGVEGEATILANTFRNTVDGAFKSLGSVIESYGIDIFDNFRDKIRDSVVGTIETLRNSKDIILPIVFAIGNAFFAIKDMVSNALSGVATPIIDFVTENKEEFIKLRFDLERIWVGIVFVFESAFEVISQQYDKFISFFRANSEEIYGVFDDIKNAISKLSDFEIDLGLVYFEEWKSGIESVFSYVSVVFNTALNEFDRYQEYFTEFFDSISVLFSSAFKGLSDAFAPIVKSFKIALDSIKLGFASLFPEVDSASSSISSAFKNVIIPAIEGFSMWVNDNQDNIRRFFNDLGIVVAWTVENFGYFTGAVIKVAGEFGKIAFDQIIQSFKDIAYAIEKVWEFLKPLGEGIVKVSTDINTAFGEIDQALGKLDITSNIEEGVGKAKEELGIFKGWLGSVFEGDEGNAKFTLDMEMKQSPAEPFSKGKTKYLASMKELKAASDWDAEYVVSMTSGGESVTTAFAKYQAVLSDIKIREMEALGLLQTEAPPAAAAVDTITKALNKQKVEAKDVVKAMTTLTDKQIKALKDANDEYQKMALGKFEYELQAYEKHLIDLEKAGLSQEKTALMRTKKTNEIFRKQQTYELKLYEETFSEKEKLSQKYLNVVKQQLDLERQIEIDSLTQRVGQTNVTEEDLLNVRKKYALKYEKIVEDTNSKILEKERERLRVTDQLYSQLEEQTTSGRFEHELDMIQMDYDKFIQDMQDKDIILSDEQMALMDKVFAERKQKAYETYTKEGKAYKQMLDGMESQAQDIFTGIFDGSIRSADDAFDNIFDSFKDMMLKMLAEAASQDLMAALFGKGEGGNIAGMFGGVFDAIGGLFGGDGKKDDSFLGSIAGGISSLFGGSDGGGEGFLGSIAGSISGLFGKDSFVGGIKDSITGIFKEGGALQGIGDMFSGEGMLGGIVGKLGSLYQGASSVIGLATSAMALAEGKTDIKTIVSAATNTAQAAESISGLVGSFSGAGTTGAVAGAADVAGLAAAEAASAAATSATAGVMSGAADVAGLAAAEAASASATATTGALSGVVGTIASYVPYIGAILQAVSIYQSYKGPQESVYVPELETGFGEKPEWAWLLEDEITQLLVRGGQGVDVSEFGAGSKEQQYARYLWEAQDVSGLAPGEAEAMGGGDPRRIISDIVFERDKRTQEILEMGGKTIQQDWIRTENFLETETALQSYVASLTEGISEWAGGLPDTMSDALKESLSEKKVVLFKGGQLKSLVKNDWGKITQLVNEEYMSVTYDALAEVVATTEDIDLSGFEMLTDQYNNIKNQLIEGVQYISAETPGIEREIPDIKGFENILNGFLFLRQNIGRINELSSDISEQSKTAIIDLVAAGDVESMKSAIGIVYDEIGKTLEGVVEESGFEEAMVDALDKFGLQLDENVAKYVSMSAAIKIATGGATAEEQEEIFKQVQIGYVTTGGELSEYITDAMKEGLSLLVEGGLTEAFQTLSQAGVSLEQLNSEEFVAKLEGPWREAYLHIAEIAETLGVPLESLAQLAEMEGLEAAATVLGEFTIAWETINLGIDQMIAGIKGEEETISQYQNAINEVGVYFDEQIKVLEELGFTEKAIIDIEERREEALQATQDKFAKLALSILDGDISAYMTELSGTTNQLNDAVSSVQDKFSGWIGQMEEYGAAGWQIAEAQREQKKAIEIVTQRYQDQRNEIMASADELAGHTQELSQYDSAINEVNNSFDAMSIQLKTLGASVDEITALEALRAEALEYEKQKLQESRQVVFEDVSSYTSGILGRKEQTDPMKQAMDDVTNQFKTFREELVTKGATEAELEKLTREQRRATSIAISKVESEIAEEKQKEYDKSIKMTMDAMAEAQKAQQQIAQQQAEAERQAQEQAVQNAIELEKLMTGISEDTLEATGNMTSYEKAMSDLNEKFDDYKNQVVALGGDQDHLAMLESHRLDMVQAKLIEFGKNIENVFGNIDDYMDGLTGQSDIVGDTIDTVNDKFDDWRATLIDNGASQVQVAKLEKQRLQATKIELQNLAQTVSDKFTEIREQIDFGGAGGRGSAQTMETIQKLMGAETFSFEGLSGMADMLVEWYNAAVSEAESAVSNMSQESNDVANNWNQVADKTQSLIDHIKDTMDSIIYSNLNLALPAEKLSEATQDYNQLLQSAKAGGETEIKEFTGFVQQYLGIAQAEYKSSQAYQDIYAQVMQDLSGVSEELSKGTYEQRMLAAVETMSSNDQINQELIEANLTSINETFEGVASWIENQISQLEEMRMFLEIDWIGLSGDSQAVIEMMSKVVDEHGWDSEVTMSFVSEMADNFTGPFEENMELLNYISTESGWESDATLMFLSDSKNFDTGDVEQVFDSLNLVVTESGGWGTEATLSFLSNTSLFSALTIEDQMKALGFVGTESGWSSTATASIVANLSDQGVPWSNIKTTMESQGMQDDVVVKQVMAAYYSQYPEWSTWGQLEEAMTLKGIDDTTIKAIQGNYTGNMSATELHTLLSAAGVSDNVIATINEQVKADVAGEVSTDLEPGMNNLNATMTENNLNTGWLYHIHGYLGVISGQISSVIDIMQVRYSQFYNFMAATNQRGFEYGGMSYGPQSGYQALLHGNELIVSPKRPYDNVTVQGGDRTEKDNREEVELLKQMIGNQQIIINRLERGNDIQATKDDKQVIVMDTEGVVVKTTDRVVEKINRGNVSIRK